MRVERFLADDMRQAMVSVRERLGNDALIFSNRRVNGQTEIIAAADDKSVDKNVVSNQREVLVEQKKESPGPRAKKAAPRKSRKNVQSSSLSDIKKELSRLRNMFEGELSQLAWRDAATKHPNKLAIQKRLEKTGLNTFVSKMIMEKVMPCKDLDEAWQNALKKAIRLINIPRVNVLEEGGVIALLGSTGVGKTTTAAKIAAQFAERHGANEVALISADNLRVGGKEQLLNYGSSLGIAVQFVSNKEELERTLNSFAQKRLVIIDTAGMSLNDMKLSDQLKNIQIASRRIHPYLVLSATTQESIIHETVRSFSSVAPKSVIITHSDECGSLGPVLSNLIRHQLSLSMVGNGPSVPDDLVKPDARLLLGNLLKSYRQAMKEDDSSEDEIPLLRSVVNA